MLEDALKYQTQGENWVKRVLLGGGVAILGIFLIPLFTFNGYMLEVMRRVMGGDTVNPPEWGELDLVDLTVDGFKHAILVLAYGLVVLLVAAVPFALIVGLGAVADSGGLSLFGILVGVGLYFVGALLLAALLPVATGNFVREGRIGAGFDLGVMRTLVTNGTMLKAILFAFVVNIIVQAVSTVLGVTVVGYLAVPFVAFAGQSAVFYVWAEGFRDAYEEAYGEPPMEPVGGTVDDVTADSDDAWGVDDDSDDTGAWD